MTVHERRAARARWLARPLARDKWGRKFDPAMSASASFSVAQCASGEWEPSPVPDLHARRASQELQRMWLRAVHKAIRRARRFRGVRRRHAQAPRGREIAQGWYVE